MKVFLETIYYLLSYSTRKFWILTLSSACDNFTCEETLLLKGYVTELMLENSVAQLPWGLHQIEPDSVSRMNSQKVLIW